MTMDSLKVISLGTFIQHAIPEPVSYQFLDADGNPEDMSAGVWTGQIKGEQLHTAAQPGTIFGSTPTVDTTTSTITYVFDPDDFTIVGRFRFTLYAGNGTNRLGVVFEFVVAPVYGAAPTN